MKRSLRECFIIMITNIMKENIITNSCDKKLPGDPPGDRGPGTCVLNELRFFFQVHLCIFPAASYDTAEENQVNLKKSFDHCVNAFCSQTCEQVISI